jgi:hypothetical protein
MNEVMSLKGYVVVVEKETNKNTDFRRVLYTGKHSQLVLMSLKPKEEIGEEALAPATLGGCKGGDKNE